MNRKYSLFLLVALLGLCTAAFSAAPKKAATSTSQPATQAAALPNIAHFRITGRVLEAPPQVNLFGEAAKRQTLRDWLNRIAQARQDSKVVGVAIELDNARLTWAQAQELGDGISRLAEVKPVYAYIASANIAQYIASAHATEIDMEPAGDLDVVGLAGEMMFFRGTLDWIGIQPQMVQIGKYKGAAEPFDRTGPSDELKGEYDKLFDDLYKQLCSQIAARRHLSVQQVQDAIDQGPFDAETAQKLHLVDKLVPRGQWQSYVGKKASASGLYTWVDDYAAPPKKELDFSNPFALLASMMKRSSAETTKANTIAIVNVDGMIVSGRSGETIFGQQIAGARTLIQTLKDVADDSRVKAVVLRINSPGGSALASELIYQAVKDCAARKPVIASVSSMAASGGYYIAVGAPQIYADPTAIVGSIGVISGKLAFSRTLEQLKIGTYAITRGKNAGMELSRPLTDDELAVLTRLAQKTYDQFVQRVQTSRGKKIARIEDVAQGRIFTAQASMENGMVDHIGGLREAVEAARAAAKITGGNIVSLPKPKTLGDIIMGDGNDDDEDDLSPIDPAAKAYITRMLGKNLRGAAYLLNLATLMRQEATLAAMPYYLDVK